MQTAATHPHIQSFANPCRAFNFLAAEAVTDPLDGKEKLVLSNWVGDGIGSLILIDPASGTGEEIRLPDDNGAWALCQHDNRYLIVGTNPNHGMICRLDLCTRQWAGPLRNPNTAYTWNVERASDGMLYFTTYPTAEILRYDPEAHTMESIGAPLPDSGNMYTRQICGLFPGWLVVTGGYVRSHLSAFNLADSRWHTLSISDDPGGFSMEGVTEARLIVKSGGLLGAFSIPEFEGTPFPAEESFTPIEKACRRFGRQVRLSDERLAGADGQEYFIEGADGRRQFFQVPVPPRETDIVGSMAVDDHGNIWGSSCFGQTLFRFSPFDGSTWNSPAVCSHMGEIFGIVHHRGLLFLASYAGGDHVIYDPSKPWDQRSNINPRTLERVSSHICRPLARSVRGPDGGVWTGWGAKYGFYGGALSRVDIETLRLEVFEDPIPGQRVMGISAGKEFIFFSTNPSGEGLPVKDDEPGWLGVWKPGSGLHCKHALGLGDLTASLLAAGDTVFVAQGDSLAVYDVPMDTFLPPIHLGEICARLILMAGGIVAALGGGKIFWIDVASKKILASEEAPGGAMDGTATPDGNNLILCTDTGLVLFTPKARNQNS